MAFNFLGIFSKSDIENLRGYLQAELDKVDAQINHMVLEENKLQKTLIKMLEYANKSDVDIESAILVQRTKEPYYLNIKVREDVEHRIKKLMDKIEQIQERIHLLRISKSEFRTNFESINALFDSFHTNLVVEKEVT
jgi:prefoldin subunit 5